MRQVFICLVGLSLLFSFQNCGPMNVQFETFSSSQSSSNDDPADLNLTLEIRNNTGFDLIGGSEAQFEALLGPQDAAIDGYHVVWSTNQDILILTNPGDGNFNVSMYPINGQLTVTAILLHDSDESEVLRTSRTFTVGPDSIFGDGFED